MARSWARLSWPGIRVSAVTFMLLGNYCSVQFGKSLLQQSAVLEQRGGGRDVWRQPAVLRVRRDMFTQQAPGAVGARAETLVLEKLEGLGRQQVLDGEDLGNVGQQLVQLERGVGAHAQVIFLQARGA